MILQPVLLGLAVAGLVSLPCSIDATPDWQHEPDASTGQGQQLSNVLLGCMRRSQHAGGQREMQRPSLR